MNDTPEKLELDGLAHPDQIVPSNTYSQTQITTYKLCPYNYYIQYVMNHREPKKSSMYLGEVCHNGFAGILKKEKTLEDAKEEAFEKLKMPSKEIIFNEKETVEDLIKSSGFILDSFHEKFSELHPDLVEEKLKEVIRGYSLMGILDSYFDSGIYMDWKIVSRFSDKSPLQVVFYSLFKPIVRGKYVMFNRKGEVKTQDVLVIKERYFYEAQIFEIINLIETGLFPKNPVEWKCSEKFCHFYNHCHNGNPL